jgi:hypothetical protein
LRVKLDLSDEKQQVLAKHLHNYPDYHRYPFAQEIQPLKAVLERLDPPKPKPAPAPKIYSPPRATAKERRG